MVPLGSKAILVLTGQRRIFKSEPRSWPVAVEDFHPLLALTALQHLLFQVLSRAQLPLVALSSSIPRGKDFT
jgi:hypothetical protein